MTSILGLTVIPVGQGPPGDDVLGEDGLALHHDHVGDELHGGLLQLPHLQVHCADLVNKDQ